MTAATATSQNALLVTATTGLDDVVCIVQELGYRPLLVDGADSINGVDRNIALCIVDLRQSAEAVRATRVVRAAHPSAVIIGIADPDRPLTSAEAIRAGIFDVLPRPVTAHDLEALMANAREQSAVTASHHLVQHEKAPFGIVSVSSSMRSVIDVVQRAAPGRCGILICGERGSGREMIARAIHAHDPSAGAPFVKVDCAGPSPEDVELELFGLLSKRANAVPERRSLERVGEPSALRDAHAGVLFLENVTALPARAQARLVRVLRDREAYIGCNGADVQPIDVRPIAQVDGDIEVALEEGRLRVDLYERLALVRIDVPALRQRREDIPVLASQFLKELCKANDKPLKSLTRPAMTLLSALPWRGNGPELRSLLERLVLLVPQGLIRLEDVLAHTAIEGTLSPSGFDATLRQARAKFEREYIAAVLQHQHGRIAEAARVLGIQRTNLYRKMRRLNLVRAKSRRDP